LSSRCISVESELALTWWRVLGTVPDSRHRRFWRELGTVPNVRQGDRGIDANASCVTTNSGDLMMAGHHSDAMLLGLFQVSVLHNVVHLLFGVGVLLTRKRAAVKA
jgi:uncharacterized protein DUF4383